MNCPFCNAAYTREMLEIYNSTYGCETGCDYYRIEVICASCEKTLYVKGDFGSFDNDDEKKTYLDEVEDSDIIEAIEKKIGLQKCDPELKAQGLEE